MSPVNLSDIAFSIVYKAFRCFEQTLGFNVLKKYFPNLKSVNEFLTSNNYLGAFPITFFVCQGEIPTIDDKLEACKKVFDLISDYVQTIQITYKGTHEFLGIPIRDVFKDRARNITRDYNDASWGNGVSQNDFSVDKDFRMDLTDKEWYVYCDNYGTSEEKKFVKYFSTIVEKLKLKFNQVYLIRNEIQASIYSFTDGSKFEPDYVLILQKQQEGKKKNNL